MSAPGALEALVELARRGPVTIEVTGSKILGLTDLVDIRLRLGKREGTVTRYWDRSQAQLLSNQVPSVAAFELEAAILLLQRDLPTMRSKT